MSSATVSVDAVPSPQTKSADTPAVRAPHVRWVRGVAIARVRYGGGRRVDVSIASAKTEAQAKARALILAELAFRMRKAKLDESKLRELLDRAGAAATEPALRSVVGAVTKIVGGEVQLVGVPQTPTFKMIGEQWVSGELARRYKDHIRERKSSRRDHGRLVRYVYPHIGDIPMDRITLEDAERVMQNLELSSRRGRALERASRRMIAAIVARVFALAVYPLKLIPSSPIPRGWLPAVGKRRAFSFLYPSEDLQLMRSADVPVQFRVLYGWLAREGMRVSEALALTPSDFDFARNRVKLDRNKTDDPRAWEMSPGMGVALQTYLKRFRRGIGPQDKIFVGPAGSPFGTGAKQKIAEVLRGHLKTAGVTRPELFERSAERQPIRVHDLRGGFVTVSLANDKTEAFVTARTGHRSSRMLAQYRRVAQTFEETKLGTFMPLGEAIPELAPPARPASTTTHAPSATRASGARPRAPSQLGHEMAQKTATPRTSLDSGGLCRGFSRASWRNSGAKCEVS